MKRSFSKFEARLRAIGLHDEVSKRARARYITLQDLYEGPDQMPSIASARRVVYVWLFGVGKGINEIARLFDRAPSGVRKMLVAK